MRKNDRFIRWQSYTLNQVTFALNFFLGLTIATLGFSVSLLMDDKFDPVGIVNFLFGTALICQLISLLFGIAAIITRTLDFRFTAQIARNAEKTGKEEFVKSLRQRVKWLGKATWFSFWMQIFLFVLGVLSLIISIIIHSDKIF